MMKLVFCLRRLPHLSRAEFQDYWRNVHAPLVAERAKSLGIKRYVQCHTVDDALFAALSGARGGHLPFDGVAEAWFDTLSDRTGHRSDEARRAYQELLEDERRFIDLAASPIFLTQENEVVST